jgi:hypothetical protein
MDATHNFSLRFAQRTESKAETTNRLLMRQTLQKISTEMSLISLSLGFSIFGMLIIVHRHQADLDGLCGSSVATVGGIGAILVGTAFFVAACLNWRFCQTFCFAAMMHHAALIPSSWYKSQIRRYL